MQADGAAHRCSPEGGLANAEGIEHRQNVFYLPVYPVAVRVVRRVTTAMATRVDKDQEELRRKGIDIPSGSPRRPVPEETVQENQRFTVPGRFEVDPHPVTARSLHGPRIA